MNDPLKSCIIRQPVQCVDNQQKDSLTRIIHNHLIGRQIAPLFDNIESIRHSIYLLYSILTTHDVCVDKQLLGQINVDLLTSIIKQNEDSELLEVRVEHFALFEKLVFAITSRILRVLMEHIDKNCSLGYRL